MFDICICRQYSLVPVLPGHRMLTQSCFIYSIVSSVSSHRIGQVSCCFTILSRTPMLEGVRILIIVCLGRIRRLINCCAVFNICICLQYGTIPVFPGYGVGLLNVLTIIDRILSNCVIKIGFPRTTLVIIPSIKCITIDNTHVRLSQFRFLIAICHTNSVACYFFKCVCIGSWILTFKHNCAFLCFIQNKRTIHMVCISIGFSCVI